MVLCPMLTCSLGCRYWYSPLPWPRISSARLAITSLAFMLVEVPAPPWITSTTNCSCSLPPRISSHASTMASLCTVPSRPSWWLACAAACLITASARIRSP
ncbi:hypothetical protein D3C85_1408180 [compost metagenome]